MAVTAAPARPHRPLINAGIGAAALRLGAGDRQRRR